MKKKRLDELETKIKGIDPEYQPLMEMYAAFKQALDAGKKRKAYKIRQRAQPWMVEDGQFTKIAVFPPNDADVAGILSLHDWHHFVKFNFGHNDNLKPDNDE